MVLVCFGEGVVGGVVGHDGAVESEVGSGVGRIARERRRGGVAGRGGEGEGGGQQREQRRARRVGARGGAHGAWRSVAREGDARCFVALLSRLLKRCRAPLGAAGDINRRGGLFGLMLSALAPKPFRMYLSLSSHEIMKMMYLSMSNHIA